ncbi:hypothetical protein ARMSODRAFT_976320 [Armillaria solidipes]|uniref:Dynamin GTPase effector domain-containing protein n=1 Tax=Armillaria solidipes TaxID=1076256 RepID=A0A2H3BAY3_9AGAR|nr:hypothetical protein ARMSODRAFT_976320 [Armillaria solidipes]
MYREDTGSALQDMTGRTRVAPAATQWQRANVAAVAKAFTKGSLFLKVRAYRDPHSYGIAISMPSPVHEATEDEEALLIMAKRFIDNVPLTIEHELHQTLLRRLSESLIKDMGMSDTSQRAREMLREDLVIASRREIVKDRIGLSLGLDRLPQQLSSNSDRSQVPTSI